MGALSPTRTFAGPDLGKVDAAGLRVQFAGLPF